MDRYPLFLTLLLVAGLVAAAMPTAVADHKKDDDRGLCCPINPSAVHGLLCRMTCPIDPHDDLFGSEIYVLA